MGGGLNFISKDQMSIPVTLLLLDDTGYVGCSDTVSWLLLTVTLFQIPIGVIVSNMSCIDDNIFSSARHRLPIHSPDFKGQL